MKPWHHALETNYSEMLPINMVMEDTLLPWKIDEVRGGAGVAMWGLDPRRGGGGFPWDSGQRTVSHGGKCVTVLIITRSFCPGTVGDVVYGFRTCYRLSDASLRMCWLLSVGSERGIILLVSYLWETRNGSEVIHWDCICYKKGGRSWISWDSPKLTPGFLEKLSILAIFIFKCVSIWMINCGHTSYSWYKRKPTFFRLSVILFFAKAQS